jgi:DNA-3-methyladenine glycosylase II
VSLGSAAAAYRRLQAVAGRVTPSRVASISERDLRAAGLTRQKAAYCRGLASAVVAGGLDLSRLDRLPDDEARFVLVELPGIGPWTADIYLLMALRRPDVWPTGDLALARALQRVKRLRRAPGEDRMARIARTWAPWRAVAARVLWHFYIRSGERMARRGTKPS